MQNWKELQHVLVHVIFHIFYFRRDWQMKFWPASEFTLFCVWISDAPPPSVLQKFKLLASSIVQVSISSSTKCDTVSVFSQLNTYIAEVYAGGTLRVNAFEFWHARGPSGLAQLAKDLTCAPALQAYVKRMFSVCGLLYSGWWSAKFRSVTMRVCLKLNQWVPKETSCPQ